MCRVRAWGGAARRVRVAQECAACAHGAGLVGNEGKGRCGLRREAGAVGEDGGEAGHGHGPIVFSSSRLFGLLTDCLRAVRARVSTKTEWADG